MSSSNNASAVRAFHTALTLFPAQQRIADSPAQRLLVAGEHQSGRTTLALYMALRAMGRGQNVYYSHRDVAQRVAFTTAVTDVLRQHRGGAPFRANAWKTWVALEGWCGGVLLSSTHRTTTAARGWAIDLLILEDCFAMRADLCADLCAATIGVEGHLPVWLFTYTPPIPHQAWLPRGKPPWWKYSLGVEHNPHLESDAAQARISA